ncbi:MAG: glucose-6-phosphate isomerase, partial [Acidimicrobiaceae bacterium]|nr:glucose-6-phosphate isomerase [Acidimicrobiaceae bacterium]
FPAHLQQLECESNGKSVTRKGDRITQRTSPVIFGEPGTNSQHSFFQMLHQGTETIPVDLIGFARLSDETSQELIANLIAQAETLAFGQDTDEKGSPLLPHKILPGDKPSTVILAPDLSPSILGQLVALYEHRTVAAGVVLGINPFDQWGVEFGKQAAKEIANELQSSKIDTNRDDSTQTLMKRYSHWRDGKP